MRHVHCLTYMAWKAIMHVRYYYHHRKERQGMAQKGHCYTAKSQRDGPSIDEATAAAVQAAAWLRTHEQPEAVARTLSNPLPIPLCACRAYHAALQLAAPPVLARFSLVREAGLRSAGLRWKALGGERLGSTAHKVRGRGFARMPYPHLQHRESVCLEVMAGQGR